MLVSLVKTDRELGTLLEFEERFAVLKQSVKNFIDLICDHLCSLFFVVQAIFKLFKTFEHHVCGRVETIILALNEFHRVKLVFLRFAAVSFVLVLVFIVIIFVLVALFSLIVQ